MTGLDGLAAIRARRPHLILLDMHLPDISGLELLRHLKADPETAPIPVVVGLGRRHLAADRRRARRRRGALPDQAGRASPSCWRRSTPSLDRIDTAFS